MTEHRASPHNLGAERALLGGLLLDHHQVDDIRKVLPHPAAFYGAPHRELYAWLLARDGEPADVITLGDHILRTGRAEDFGGISYATGLPEHCPSTSNLGHYAATVADLALARQLLEFGGAVRQLALDGRSGSEVLQHASKALDAIVDGADATQGGWRDLASILLELHERTQRIADGEERAPLVKTGIPALDDVLGGGMVSGDGCVLIAGRPSMGKTALAMTIAQNVAQAGDAVAIFSQEMSDLRLGERVWAGDSGVFATKIRTGKDLVSYDWERLDESHGRLHGLPMWVDDTPQLPISQVRARARSLKRRVPGLRLIVVDYIQIMGSDGTSRSREQEIAERSAGLTAMGKELGVAVVVLAQLNRKVEERSDKTPMMSDLRESGALEQDANLVLFPFRPSVYDDEADDQEAHIIIGKARDGAKASRVKVRWNGPRTRFEPW